jgi:NAD-reducing hydrogenase large subunit
MSKTIVIDPVTRIEGHSKITIHLDEQGDVADAQFHVNQFRGFERIVQGRPVHEMPSIMARRSRWGSISRPWSRQRCRSSSTPW